MIRYVLDANIVLRLLRDDHPKHSSQARALFADAAAGRCELILPQVVLAECVWVLRSFYATEPAAIAEPLLTLINAPGIVADEPAVASDALRRMSTTKLDYIDCYVAARAANSQDAVASFDRDFRKFQDVRCWQPAT